MEWESCSVAGFGIDGIELYCSAARGFFSNMVVRVTGCEDGRMGNDWNWVRIVSTCGCWSEQC